MEPYKVSKKSAKIFQKGIYQWSAKFPREMPWKGEKDAYKIWVSEIILQQTRVEQGRAYYERFIMAFPTIQKLARADLDKVLKLWEGLGYYTRARNLHQSAKTITTQFNGHFPNQYENIISLKGVGVYTASAIASFAFDLPHAVLDGNVHRILSRYFGLKLQMKSSLEKKSFQTTAESLLDLNQPGKYNQAIMDFGAMCCLPQLPKCDICPLKKTCFAFQNKQVELLPPPAYKLTKKTRHFHYYLVGNKKKVYIQQRASNDIWQGLYEFPLIETKNKNQPKPEEISLFNGSAKKLISEKQVLSHQIIHTYFYRVNADIKHKKNLQVSVEQFKKLPMPVSITKHRELFWEVIKGL